MIIFGASGDLTKRKLMPALYALYKDNRLPEDFAVLGIGRTEYQDDTYRTYIRTEMERFVAPEEHADNRMADFCDRLHYLSLNPAEAADYGKLAARLQELTGEQEPDGMLYYLATPPSLYGVIPLHLKAAGLNRPHTRIIVEKPFGYDLDSARELNRIYASVFEEHQIYRIDHFLGKETAQNILAFRFANGIFEPLWNRNYIDYVEITAVENLGIEQRGGFYEGAGALRDMVQNHLIQLVALTAMEPPAVFNADNFRNEVVKVYESLSPLTEEDLNEHIVRGQYTASATKPGYREEKNVAPDSRTETYIAMKIGIDNWRWSGVPFYIRTGKQMPTYHRLLEKLNTAPPDVPLRGRPLPACQQTDSAPATQRGHRAEIRHEGSGTGLRREAGDDGLQLFRPGRTAHRRRVCPPDRGLHTGRPDTLYAQRCRGRVMAFLRPRTEILAGASRRAAVRLSRRNLGSSGK